MTPILNLAGQVEPANDPGVGTTQYTSPTPFTGAVAEGAIKYVEALITLNVPLPPTKTKRPF